MNLRLAALVTLAVLACAALGLFRLRIDTDVVRSLPGGDRVIADALDIFTHHPIHDQIAVDITLDRDDPDLLAESGLLLSRKMNDSGLFARVGMEEIGALLPEIARQVVEHLPLLLSAEDLQQLAPRLESRAVLERVRAIHRQLAGLDGIGQAEFFSRDPLGFRELILAKMASLAPNDNTTLYRGQLFSRDRRHLLITARPLNGGTDSAQAERLDRFFQDSARLLQEAVDSRNAEITLTPVGAYRAALDNERIIRHDVNLALLLATAGIAFLLLFSFPRPLAGLVALVPALAGTAAALLVYSLIHPAISIMVLGFGGAIISITVDHGITYMLFLDRSRRTEAKEASREVRAIGIMAVITTIGAFLVLSFSGFPVFAQLGAFTALGIFFSFLFVHFVLPRLLPSLPPASGRRLPLRRLVGLLYSTGRYGAGAAVVLALVLLAFARPDFQVSLESMNTVSRETLQADETFTSVWGGPGKKVFVMTRATTIPALQRNNDRLLAMVEKDIARGVLSRGFVPSMLFPGAERAAANLADWHAFWTPERRNTLRARLEKAGRTAGFNGQAFAPFLDMLEPGFTRNPPVLAPKFFPLLGITAEDNGLVQFISLDPGPGYRPEPFFSRYSESGKIFDPAWFSTRLADILFSTFTRMLAIIAVSLVILLVFFYLDLTLTLLTLTPVLFAYICTLGTLKLIGHPLDIPALMLSIIILGMGIDYSIFTVRAHQRYRRTDHPLSALVRVSVFLAGMSTLIGFGVLCFADHTLLRSIGITSFTGIGFSLAGTFLLLPPLLERYFSQRRTVNPADPIDKRVRDRFRLMETYPRMFARFKLRLDPLFSELPRVLVPLGEEQVRTIIDIGCGYGVPACWCLEYFPHSRVYGIDPDPERIRVASLATGERGRFSTGLAPELPEIPAQAQLVLLLDMLHYLDDDTVRILFSRARAALEPGGLLAARYVVRPEGGVSVWWKIEDRKVRASGNRARYRRPEETAALLEQAGFTVMERVVSANPELVWVCATTDDTPQS